MALGGCSEPALTLEQSGPEVVAAVPDQVHVTCRRLQLHCALDLQAHAGRAGGENGFGHARCRVGRLLVSSSPLLLRPEGPGSLAEDR